MPSMLRGHGGHYGALLGRVLNRSRALVGTLRNIECRTMASSRVCRTMRGVCPTRQHEQAENRVNPWNVRTLYATRPVAHYIPRGLLHGVCHEACCTVYTTMPVARYLQHEHAENRVNHTRPTDVHTDARFESELQQEIAELRTDLKASNRLRRPSPLRPMPLTCAAWPTLRRIPTSARSRLRPFPLRPIPT